jgi:Uma2 family endonuclease
LEPLPPEEWPNVDDLVTEDDTPVDNFFSAKQQRLLVEPLYSSWEGPGEGRPFLADENVALYHAVGQRPLVPDVFLSLDVQVAEDWFAKRHRTYFYWEFGKAPEVAIEIVSNTKGEEGGYKLHGYARMNVLYYIIWDPSNQLQAGALRIFVLRDKEYVPLTEAWLPGVGLGLTTWQGTFEEKEALWLRWCDRNGAVILTGKERAEQERQRAEQERQRAEQERQRAEQEQRAKEEAVQRLKRLAAQLRALGVEPES